MRRGHRYPSESIAPANWLYFRFIESLRMIAEFLAERRIVVRQDLRLVAHMCERILFMNSGQVVEETDADSIRAGKARDPYTNELMASSRGRRRNPATAPSTS